MDNQNRTIGLVDKWMMLSLFGIVAIVVFLVAAFIFGDEDSFGVISIALAGLAIAFGICALPSQRKWKYLILALYIVIAIIFALIAYVFLIKW